MLVFRMTGTPVERLQSSDSHVGAKKPRADDCMDARGRAKQGTIADTAAFKATIRVQVRSLCAMTYCMPVLQEP